MIDIKEMENTFGPGCYPMRDPILVKGRGASVWDDKGREYIDCMSGHGVANIGHANKKVIDGIHKQARELITCPSTFYSPPRARLLQKLNDLTPAYLKRTFLCNSGAEAVEAALKMARAKSGRTGVVAAMRSFHGRTFGALSATHAPKYKKGFEPLVPGFTHVPFNKPEKMDAAITHSTAAVILEIVQGEGGVNIGDKTYFQEVRALCNDRQVALIIDEVQTGFCRTGKMFAFEHMEIEPDIVCVAKAMGGGMPIGAIFFADAYRFSPGKHGSTFGGNPLACAAALGAIDFMLNENLAGQASEKGRYFLQHLNRIASPKIRQIRGMGLIIGLELKVKAQPYIKALVQKGILTLPAGTTVLRLLPPLVISYKQIDKVISGIEAVLSEVKI